MFLFILDSTNFPIIHMVLRWSIVMTAYSYDSAHCRGNGITQADLLLRYPGFDRLASVNSLRQLLSNSENCGSSQSFTTLLLHGLWNDDDDKFRWSGRLSSSSGTGNKHPTIGLHMWKFTYCDSVSTLTSAVYSGNDNVPLYRLIPKINGLGACDTYTECVTCDEKAKETFQPETDGTFNFH